MDDSPETGTVENETDPAQRPADQDTPEDSPTGTQSEGAGAEGDQKRISDAQAKMHEATERASEAEKDKAVLQVQLDALKQVYTQAPQQEQGYTQEQIAKVLEDSSDDPSVGIKFLMEVIGKMDAQYQQNMVSMQQSYANQLQQVNPDRNEYKAELDALSTQISYWTALNGDQQLEQAKAMRKASGKSTGPVEASPGSLPESRREQKTTKKADPKDKFQDQLRMTGAIKNGNEPGKIGMHREPVHKWRT